MVSAHPDSFVEEAALAAGADCFFRKPFNIIRFQEKLTALLGKSVGGHEEAMETRETTGKVFLEVFPEYYRTLQACIAEEDMAGIRRQIHKMRGALSVCGNDPLKEALNDLRDAAAAGEECGEYAAAFGELLDEFYATLCSGSGESEAK